MKEYKLNFIPFDHKDIDKWRQSLSSGISYLDKDTNLIIKGGIDDVHKKWNMRREYSSKIDTADFYSLPKIRVG